LEKDLKNRLATTYLFNFLIRLQSSAVESSSDGDGSNGASHDPSADSLSLRGGHVMLGEEIRFQKSAWLQQWQAVCGRVGGERWKKCKSSDGRPPFAKAVSPPRDCRRVSPLFLLNNKQRSLPRLRRPTDFCLRLPQSQDRPTHKPIHDVAQLPAKHFAHQQCAFTEAPPALAPSSATRPTDSEYGRPRKPDADDSRTGARHACTRRVLGRNVSGSAILSTEQ